MTNDGEPNEELLARRAAVFRRMREEQRQASREARRRWELGIPPDDLKLPTSSARANAWSTVVGTLGTALVLRFTPTLSLALEIPEALAFAATGALLGAVLGVTRDASSWESRVEHALGFGVAFAVGLGGLSLL